MFLGWAHSAGSCNNQRMNAGYNIEDGSDKRNRHLSVENPGATTKAYSTTDSTQTPTWRFRVLTSSMQLYFGRNYSIQSSSCS